ncbi:MAG: hypothetical protein H6813_01390 [Phycisphaeraceae bacterium]|nr:hypothetical protein [Phycisphaeraceae bacterium]
MTIDAATIETLAGRLTKDEPKPLTPDERRLLVAALETLAADQGVIVRLQRLLVAKGESLERIDALTTSALAGVRARLNQPSPDEGFDYAAADLARQSLAGAVNNAKSGRAAITAALQFVRDFVTLAG